MRPPAALRALFVTLVIGACAAQPVRGPVAVASAQAGPAKPQAAEEITALPNAEDSLKFAVSSSMRA